VEIKVKTLHSPRLKLQLMSLQMMIYLFNFKIFWI
jgi:hypothetical protein